MIDKSKIKNVVNRYTDLYCKLRDIEICGGKIDELSTTDVVKLYIEPTNRCNLHCKFCARDNMKRNLSNMTLGTFINAFTDLKIGSKIIITGNGEPLMNPDIYDMIKCATEAGHYVSIITNGTALTEENADKLIDSGLSRIQISFQSIEKSAYEEIMVGANYERTLKQVLRFIYKVRRKKINLFISISTVMVKDSMLFAENSKDFWMKMPIDNYYESELFSLQTNSKMYSQSQQQDESTIETHKVCVVPWAGAKINADGSVNPCAHDFSSKYVIGNINDNTFNEIINGEKARRFREALICDNQEFLDEIGYHCGKCNTWTDKAGYGITKYMKNTYPVVLATEIDEIGTIRQNYDCVYLEETMRKWDIYKEGG